MSTVDRRLRHLFICCAFATCATGLIAPVWHDEAVAMLHLSKIDIDPAWPPHMLNAGDIRTVWLDNVGELAQVMSSLVKNDVHPPLFYVCAWVASLSALHINVIILRLISVCFWLGTLALLHKASLKSSAVLMLAVSPLGIALATLAKGYTLAMFFIALALYCTTEERVGRGRFAVLAGFAGAASVWSHYLAVSPVLIVLGWASARRRIRSSALVMLLTFSVVAAPALYLAHHQTRPGANGPFPGIWRQIYVTIREYLRMPLCPFLELGRVVDYLGSAIVLFAIIAVGITIRKKAPLVQLSFLVVVGHAALMAALSFWFQSNLSSPRFLALSLPFCYVVLAEACPTKAAFSRLWVPSICAFMLLASSRAAAGILRMNFQRHELLDDRSALVIISDRRQPGQVFAILYELPASAKFIPLSSASGTPEVSNLYGRKVFVCLADWESAAERRLAAPYLKTGTREIRLFRDYSCASAQTKP